MPKTILAQREHSLTADTKLVISHGNWRKRDYVDVRVHWQSPDGKWFPTKKGVRVGVDLAITLESDLACMLGITRPKNGNGEHPASNGDGWGRNKRGGYKVNWGRSLRIPRRRQGVRCYGWNPYEGQPPIYQPILVPSAFYASMHGLSGHSGTNRSTFKHLCPQCST